MRMLLAALLSWLMPGSGKRRTDTPTEDHTAAHSENTTFPPLDIVAGRYRRRNRAGGCEVSSLVRPYVLAHEERTAADRMLARIQREATA
jgi:hypothetical protein